jgi:hypothetical protein
MILRDYVRTRSGKHLMDAPRYLPRQNEDEASREGRNEDRKSNTTFLSSTSVSSRSSTTSTSITASSSGEIGRGTTSNSKNNNSDQASGGSKGGNNGKSVGKNSASNGNSNDGANSDSSSAIPTSSRSPFRQLAVGSQSAEPSPTGIVFDTSSQPTTPIPEPTFVTPSLIAQQLSTTRSRTKCSKIAAPSAVPSPAAATAPSILTSIAPVTTDSPPSSPSTPIDLPLSSQLPQTSTTTSNTATPDTLSKAVIAGAVGKEIPYAIRHMLIY